MARKKFDEEHENHERWLVSYADLVTLLFAFFVVMYSISSLNEGKYRVLSMALGAAFGRGDVPALPTTVPDKTGVPQRPMLTPKQRSNDAALRREKENMTQMARDILKALAPLVKEGKVRVTQSTRGISVEINASVLFAPGDASLNSESGQALTAVAQVLKNDAHAIKVEGYTDNVPIKTALFPSNWELSAVRASSVVRLFVENGVAEKRLMAVGHGSNRPVGPNDTTEERQRNRRVEVLILWDLPEEVTEVPVETPVTN